MIKYFLIFLFSHEMRAQRALLTVPSLLVWARAAARLSLPPPLSLPAQFSWQIPVLASPGLSCSDSVPAVVVVREGRGGEGGDKTWCCILEQGSAGHATWGISET